MLKWVILGISIILLAVIPAMATDDSTIAADVFAGGIGSVILVGLIGLIGRFYKPNKDLGFFIAATTGLLLVIVSGNYSKRILAESAKTPRNEEQSSYSGDHKAMVRDASGPEGDDDPRDLSDALIQDPEMGPTFKSLRDNFPDRYAVLVAGFQNDMDSGMSSSQLYERLISLHGLKAIAPLRSIMHKSSDVDLVSIADARLKAMTYLGDKEPESCRKMISRGIDRSTMRMPGFKPLVNNVSIAIIEAAAHASSNPIDRDEPTSDQYAKFVRQASSQGVDAGNMANIDNLPPKQMCLTAIGMYQAALNMGPMDRAAILAVFIKE